MGRKGRGDEGKEGSREEGRGEGKEKEGLIKAEVKGKRKQYEGSLEAASGMHLDSLAVRLPLLMNRG